MSSLGWLHLTDLHMGGKRETVLYPTVRDEFFEDLRFLHEESGPWDIVFFTGDLTFSGEQFEDFDSRFWRRLSEHLRSLGSTPILVPVPGNHDLRRGSVKGSVLKALEHYADDPSIRDIVRTPDGAGDEYHRELREAFFPYTQWLASLPIANTPSYRTGLFPGDYSVTLNFRGVSVGVVALNTATIHLGDQFSEGRLALPVGQFLGVVPEPPDFVEQHDVLVLLTHHPRSWINPSEAADFDRDIWPAGRFDIHLHGHMHSPSSALRGANSGRVRHVLQGASIFGLEHLRDGTTARIHGYSAGRFFVGEETVATTVWPRVARAVGDGSRRIGPDLAFDLDRRKQSYCVPHEFQQIRTERSEFLSFDAVGWDDIFRSATRLELVTNYADSWFQRHLDSLTAFLKRGGQLSVLLPDPNESLCLSVLRVRYPDYSRDSALAILFEKVAETARRVLRLADHLGVASAVEVLLTPNPPSYWALRVDERTVFFSPFEYRRQERVVAPVFTVDATAEPSRAYWHKEFMAFAQGQRIRSADAEKMSLVGQPGARVQKFANRDELYRSVREMIESSKVAIYDTSWGWEPVRQTTAQRTIYRDDYRKAIETVCAAGNVSYREIVDMNVHERVTRAVELTKRLHEFGKVGQYQPRFLRLPSSLPMLEYLVVDAKDMIISGLGADQNEFLRISGGSLPALVSTYLEKVWMEASEGPVPENAAEAPADAPR